MIIQKKLPRILPVLLSTESKAIFSALENKARFIGGCVRDAILAREVTDIDIATPWVPEQVIAALQSHQIKWIAPGLQHGTVTAVIKKQHYEITTLRKDIQCDGRHARVEFTTDWQRDAMRRDFTINALSCDDQGEVYDYVGGWEDVQHHRVRFIGNAFNRCQEDYLRILRYFRFLAWYGKNQTDVQALAACQKLAAQIKQLSGARIHKELYRLIAADDPVTALTEMEKTGVATYVFPLARQFSALANCLHIAPALGMKTTALLRLFILLITKETSLDQLEACARQWQYSNKQSKYWIRMWQALQRYTLETLRHKPYEASYWLGKEVYQDSLLIKLSTASAKISLKNLQEDKHRLEQLKFWDPPVMPLKAEDIMAIGVLPGKKLGKLLHQAEQIWVETGFSLTKKSLLEKISEE